MLWLRGAAHRPAVSWNRPPPGHVPWLPAHSQHCLASASALGISVTTAHTLTHTCLHSHTPLTHIYISSHTSHMFVHSTHMHLTRPPRTHSDVFRSGRGGLPGGGGAFVHGWERALLCCSSRGPSPRNSVFSPLSLLTSEFQIRKRGKKPTSPACGSSAPFSASFLFRWRWCRCPGKPMLHANQPGSTPPTGSL